MKSVLSLRKNKLLFHQFSDLSIDAKTTIAIQTQLTSGTSLTSDLFIEGGFSKDNSYFVARIITKAQPKNKTSTVQILNLTERRLFLLKNTEIADAILFVKENNTNLERKEPPLLESRWFSEKDLTIGHLETEQRRKLIELIRR